MGDPSGIGAEIIAKALLSSKLDKRVRFIVVGDRFVFEKALKSHRAIESKRQSVQGMEKVEFVDLKNVDRENFSFGKVKREYGRAALEYIDAALAIIKKENILALVTAPVSKEAVSLCRKDFRGQTEYLAKKAHVRNFGMLLANDRLKIALVTRHISIKEVAKKITTKSICDTVKITAGLFKKFYKIINPRIVVCGLNPHASDNGLIGKEENSVIVPAINKLKKECRCSGPYPADTVFNLALSGKFDAVVAMYHDQALIALKITGKESGFNITMGLPFLRISPLHGTAFDIAGKCKADPSSMISAINFAQQHG